MARPLWNRMVNWVQGSGTESRRFGGYHVVKLIHEGEKSSVYQARSPEGDGPAVVKCYRPYYNRTARRICKRYNIRREGEMGLLINPDSRDGPADWPIVRTLGQGFEFGDPGKCYYVVLEYIEGLNARHLLGCKEPLFREERLNIARSVGRALSIFHARGLIHRDVCLDNVLVTRDRRVKLIDLGFMVPVGIAFKEKSGTPSYMSPEQFLAKPLYATSDIYAYGVLLFELFTGELPFVTRFPTGKPELAARRMSELMAMHVKEPPPKPSERATDLPDGIEPIILKCLEKDPAKRYQDIRGALNDLSKVRDDGA